MNPEIRRKQVEEILERQDSLRSSSREKAADSILALLSDAERKGAWAVVRRVEEVHNSRDADGPLASYNTSIGFVQAARQVASSFGPDPEGK